MKTNYHTHDERCKHAIGKVEDYVKKAIEEGYDEIGLSDHMPHFGMDFDSKARMDFSMLSGYFNEVDEVREKYRDKISIKKGMECEYFYGMDWFYKELKEKYNLDYMILGGHFFKHREEWVYVGWELTDAMLLEYIDFIVLSMETGYFKYLAHPDLFFIIYKEWNEKSEMASRRLLETAEKLDMPIEININGYKKAKVKTSNGERYPYPMREFWELSKEYNVKRIIGVDAHNPKNLEDYNKGLEFAKSLGLEIIDHLEF